MTTLETEQSSDTRLTQLVRGPFILRFASYRKSEDAKLGLRSEDYLVSDLSPAHAMFALCDGVGTSFYGNIGSQFLGETLTHWLRNILLPESLSESSVKKWLDGLNSDLTRVLTNIVALATSTVKEKELSSHDHLTKIAEISQRDDYGTQSNFVCGRIWPKSPQLPNGMVVVFWVGNARGRIFHGNNDLSYLLKWGANPDQLKEVWSSKEGIIGKLYSFQTDLSQVDTILAYSDGLEDVEEHIGPNLNGVQIEGLVKRAQASKDDDISFMQISVVDSDSEAYSDDIVEKVRKHFSASTSSGSNQYQKKFNELLKSFKDLEAKAAKTKRDLLILMVALILLVFPIGMLVGSFLTERQPLTATETATPTRTLPTSTPSYTPTVTPVLTETTSPTITPTFTETFTSTPTSTFTETASPTATITPSFTAAPTDTP